MNDFGTRMHCADTFYLLDLMHMNIDILIKHVNWVVPVKTNDWPKQSIIIKYYLIESIYIWYM